MIQLLMLCLENKDNFEVKKKKKALLFLTFPASYGSMSVSYQPTTSSQEMFSRLTMLFSFRCFFIT